MVCLLEESEGCRGAKSEERYSRIPTVFRFSLSRFSILLMAPSCFHACHYFSNPRVASACRARKGFVTQLPIHQLTPWGTIYCVDCIRITTHSNLFSVPSAIIRMLKQGLNPRRAIVIHTYQLNLTFSDEPDRSPGLRPDRLLRTVRASFPAYGSSISKGYPCGTPDSSILLKAPDAFAWQ